MAIDKGAYSLQQFKLAIKNETTLGTENKTSMQLVNLDGFPSVSHNTFVSTGVKHGDGRTLKQADVYTTAKGQVHELTFTCTWDQTVGQALLGNCIGVAAGTSPSGYEIDYNYTGPECAIGDTDTDYTGAITVALISPEGSNTEIWAGCVVKTLRVYCDAGSDGGRLHADVTIVTKKAPTTGQAAPTTPSAYPTTFRTIYDASTTKSIFGADVVLNRWEITIENNVKFFGIDSSGNYTVFARGIPSIDASGVFGVKYDANTAGFIASAIAGTNCAIHISNNASWASATFGIYGAYGEITQNFHVTSVEEGAFIDVPIRFVASTDNDLFEMVA